MKKQVLNNYIIEQIFILEQKFIAEEKESINEIKVKNLLGLGVLGILGAFLAKGDLTSTSIANKGSIEQQVNNAYKEKSGKSLTRGQIETIKKGEDLAGQMSKDEVLEVIANKPNFYTILKQLFQKSNIRLKHLKMFPKYTPIASIEDINLGHIFLYSQKDLENYFEKEKNRNEITLNDGTCLLDIDIDKLNKAISNPDSNPELSQQIIEFAVNALDDRNEINDEAFAALMDAAISEASDEGTSIDSSDIENMENLPDWAKTVTGYNVHDLPNPVRNVAQGLRGDVMRGEAIANFLKNSLTDENWEIIQHSTEKKSRRGGKKEFDELTAFFQ